MCLAHELHYYILQAEINCLLHLIFSGIIASGYFHPCREFNPEVCELVEKLVSTGRILWQRTKV